MNNRRNLLVDGSSFKFDENGATYVNGVKVVDLHLPSGNLWASSCIGKTAYWSGVSGVSYKVAEEGWAVPYPAFFCWGSKYGYTPFDISYYGVFTENDYNRWTSGNHIDPNDAEHDSALATLGAPFHMPTRLDFRELIYFTTNSQYGNSSHYSYDTSSYRYGYAGIECQSKVNPNAHISIPMCGSGYNGKSQSRDDVGGNYWASDAEGLQSDYAGSFRFYGGERYYIGNPRSSGYNIMPIISTNMGYEVPQFVDLGLPSGTKWAIDVIRFDEAGEYTISWRRAEFEAALFQWGNTEGSTYNNSSFTSNQPYDYFSTTGGSLTGNLPSGNSTYDAARACLGGNWKIPTLEQFTELKNNCTINNGLITGPNGNSVRIPGNFQKRGWQSYSEVWTADIHSNTNFAKTIRPSDLVNIYEYRYAWLPIWPVQ